MQHTGRTIYPTLTISARPLEHRPLVNDSFDSEQHHGDSMHIAGRTYFLHSLLHVPSRYHPAANGKLTFTFCLLNYEFQTLTIFPFATGFKVVLRHHS